MLQHLCSRQSTPPTRWPHFQRKRHFAERNFECSSAHLISQGSGHAHERGVVIVSVMRFSVWASVGVGAVSFLGLAGLYVQQQGSGFASPRTTWKENVSDKLPFATHPRHSNWDFFALSRAACTNIGWPLMSVTDSMLPSGWTDTSSFTSPAIMACPARGG